MADAFSCLIQKCKCKHLFQDEKYGEGMRVHNPLVKTQNQPQKYRCTVCEAIAEEFRKKDQ